jgi:hypothetical protein
MDVMQEESQDECAPSVLHLLIHHGQSHFDVFASINDLLEVETRRAVAGSCRSARALTNAAVRTVHLSEAAPPPLQRDLAEVFPSATVLDVDLQDNGGEEPCDSSSAAQMLRDWGTSTPRLLSQLSSISLRFSLVAMMDTTPAIGFHSEVMDLLGRCVVGSSACTVSVSP